MRPGDTEALNMECLTEAQSVTDVKGFSSSDSFNPYKLSGFVLLHTLRSDAASFSRERCLNSCLDLSLYLQVAEDSLST